MTKKDIEKVVNAVFDGIAESLTKGDKVQIIGFGTFDVRDVRNVKGVIQATGETITIPAAKVPVFKTGKALRESVK